MIVEPATPEDLVVLKAQQPDAYAKLAVGPYANANLGSKARAMQLASQPKSLAGYVRWARWAYRFEVPSRLHSHDVGDDGSPRWTGQFVSFLQAHEMLGTACAIDEDGQFRTPFLCAWLTLHGRDEQSDSAAMAHFVYAIAATDEPTTPWEIADRIGIKPSWVVRPAAELALGRIWAMYASSRSMR